MDEPIPKEQSESLYAGLRAIWNIDFPKACEKCGRTYEDFDHFIAGTTRVGTGQTLIDYESSEASQMRQVGVFRNCECGSTLSVLCGDRRDISPAGEQRREIFERLLHNLMDAGLTRGVARRRLLTALRSPSDTQAISALLRKR